MSSWARSSLRHCSACRCARANSAFSLLHSSLYWFSEFACRLICRFPSSTSSFSFSSSCSIWFLDTATFMLSSRSAFASLMSLCRFSISACCTRVVPETDSTFRPRSWFSACSFWPSRSSSARSFSVCSSLDSAFFSFHCVFWSSDSKVWPSCSRRNSRWSICRFVSSSPSTFCSFPDNNRCSSRCSASTLFFAFSRIVFFVSSSSQRCSMSEMWSRSFLFPSDRPCSLFVRSSSFARQEVRSLRCAAVSASNWCSSDATDRFSCSTLSWLAPVAPPTNVLDWLPSSAGFFRYSGMKLSGLLMLPETAEADTAPPAFVGSLAGCAGAGSFSEKSSASSALILDSISCSSSSSTSSSVSSS
mmetsp:Transcript_1184/g.2604  ORF Transcript_1184/g.2604 Transcript_1184/m.2604 type:complete len:360 (+) Transcript_1184:997-2076(+)